MLERNAAEQDVVLDRKRRAETVGLEEFDDIFATGVTAAEFGARLDDFALHVVVDHAQAVLRRDEPEGQRQQARLFFVRRRRQRAIGDLRQQRPELGQSRPR